MNRKGKTDRKKNILFVSLTSTFVISFMGSGLNPAVPTIGAEFGAGAAEAAWVVTAYMLTCTALPLPFGRVADTFDRKKILITGLVLFTAGSLAGGFSRSLGQLLCCRLVQGAGTAMIYSTSMSVLVSAGKEGDQGRLLGWSTAATYLGLAAGPAAGGILTFQSGWRWIFFVAAAVSAAVSVCALRQLFFGADGFPGKAESSDGFRSPRKIQIPGILFLWYISAVAVLLFGLSAAAAQAWGWVLTAVGLAGIAALTVYEWKGKLTILPVQLLRKQPVFGGACLASMVNYGTHFVLNYLLSVYLQVGLGYSAQKTGLILVISPAVQAALSPLAGRSGRPRLLSAAGMLGTAAVAAGFAAMKAEWPEWTVFAGLAGAGVSCAFFASPNTRQAMTSAGSDNFSAAAAVLSTMRSLGHTLSMVTAAAASAWCLGGGELAGAEAGQILEVMKLTLFLWCGLCILGFFMALAKKV